MDAPIRIGAVKGPGETPHEYTLIAPDPERIVRNGEFVYYVTQVDGEARHILGRVTGRRSARLLPDSFMADPSVPPQEIAALLGYESSQTELFEITVAVLGYYDAVLGDFINPRVPPAGGSPVFIADDQSLSLVLSRRQPREVGSALLGSLLSRPAGAVPVALDVRGFTSTHMAIIASTGSGKSYLAGVLLEELMMPYNRAAVMIIDPHGEYGTMQEIANLPQFREGNYKPRARIFRPDQVKVRFDTLTLADLRYLMSNMTDKMHFQLARAYGRTQKNYRGKYTLEELMHQVREAADNRRSDEESIEGDDDPTTSGIIWRLNGLKQSSIFNDNETLDLRELFQPGQCTVLQLNEVPQREQQVIAATLLRRAYNARVETEKKIAQRGEPNYLPYPVFTLIEEAHNFAPAAADAVTTEALKTILSEGRKFGVSVGLISQRPGKLDADVLSQCMTQCIMRITNPIDQDRIASSIESVGRDLIRELPSLSKGQVIVSGASVNTPVLLRVRARVTSHGGQDVNAPEAWRRFTEEDEISARRDASPVLDPRLTWDDDGDILFSGPV
jgi:hypothetical protein